MSMSTCLHDPVTASATDHPDKLNPFTSIKIEDGEQNEVVLFFRDFDGLCEIKKAVDSALRIYLDRP